jgi:hypothetical protein
MRSRLDALHLQRQAASQQRREAASEAWDPVQDTAAFQARMETVQVEVQDACVQLRSSTADGSGQQADGAPLTAAARAALAQAGMQRITELEQVSLALSVCVLCSFAPPDSTQNWLPAFQDAAQCAFFLPKYDLRAALDLAATLRQQLGAAQAEAAPKKRFAFGARPQSTAPRPVTLAAAAHAPAPEASTAQPDAEPSCPGLRRAAAGSTHVIRLDAMPDSGAEYAIEDCTGAHARSLVRHVASSCDVIITRTPKQGAQSH